MLSAALLAFALLLTACSGSENNSGEDAKALLGSTLGNSFPCEFPLVTDNTTLNYLISGYGDIKADDVFVRKKYEEMTGVNINRTTVKKSERSEKVATALTGKSDIDCILRCKISSDKLTQYGENGLILNLAKDDMLQKYAPNCRHYLTQTPTRSLR